VAVDDLRQVILDGGILDKLVIAGDVMNDDIPTVSLKDTLDKVMLLFGSRNREELPVIDVQDGNRLKGVVTRQALISAYNTEIMKRDAVSEVAVGIGSAEESKQVLLSGGIAMAEVEAPGWMVGRTLADLDLRKNRGVQVLMIQPSTDGPPLSEPLQLVPRPDYSIQLGDNLLVLGPRKAVENLKA
jgi:uncharacterized protein with PhoU and TrkA domain